MKPWLVNIPATFQKLVEVVLTGFACDVCYVYFYGILVFTKILDERNQNVERELDRIKKDGLKLKPNKW